MGLLSYSRSLVAGTAENIGDVMVMFNEVKAVLNGQIDGDNLDTTFKTSLLKAEKRSVTVTWAGGATNSFYVTVTHALGINVEVIAMAQDQVGSGPAVPVIFNRTSTTFGIYLWTGPSGYLPGAGLTNKISLLLLVP